MPESQSGPHGMAALNLENCDREPIHIPGAIQSQGALVAVDGQGVVRFASENCERYLGVSVIPGQDVTALSLFVDNMQLARLLDEGLAALSDDGDVPMPIELVLGQFRFDVVPHRSADLIVFEFEARQHSADEYGDFAIQAHRAMEKLRRPRASINDLLQLATKELKALTGFDRVMAYRFRADSSGDVVGESLEAFLSPFLGMRYPASDIPAQARALYVANTLRTIVDVSSLPVQLVQRDRGPLDLSASILRSVSPIHIEYLSNMGVGASMSVSIVINARLWGLIACHHMGPKQVPYSVRMACDVIGQMLSANIHTALASKLAEKQLQVGKLRTRILEDVLHSDDEFAALSSHAAELGLSLGADAVIVSQHSKLFRSAELPREGMRALLHWLTTTRPGDALFQTDTLVQHAPEVAGLLAPFCGVLALPLDINRGGWLIFLRREQVQTINWGGRPEKLVRQGPLGLRLTPRGSFDLWSETVRFTSEQWASEDLDAAGQLLAELIRAQNTRHAELNNARAHLMAVLGHDLRDPLQSITMAARVLEKSGGEEGVTGRVGQRIKSSSNRMNRLVSQVMDMSRLQSRLGLGLRPVTIDLVPLLADLIDEARMAHPGVELQAHLPEQLLADVDADRISQVFSNLISNARHHGTAGHAIEVHGLLTPEGPHIAVRNVAPPIPAEVADSLFAPFKQSSLGHELNRSGLGLGLYIAHEIVQGHGGSIGYAFEEPHVVFLVRLRGSAVGS